MYGFKEMYARPGCAFVGAVGMLFEVVPEFATIITEQSACLYGELWTVGTVYATTSHLPWGRLASY